MLKHRVRTFSSDVFLLMECIGAVLTIGEYHDSCLTKMQLGLVHLLTHDFINVVSVDKGHSQIQISPADFLNMDMTGRVILNVIIPPMSQHNQFVSFKVGSLLIKKMN